MKLHASVEALRHVASRLGALNDEVVYVGGSIIPLLVPASIAPTIRPTDDVDLVVQATTYIDYHAVEEQLEGLGFERCRDGPVCRWVVDEIRVDVMPSSEAALGFSNQWYDQVLLDPLEIEVVEGLRVRIAGPAAFIATKFEAFDSRGHGDYDVNADFEDIVTVLATREDIVDATLSATGRMRDYLVQRMRILHSLPNLTDLVRRCFDQGQQPDAVPAALTAIRLIAEKYVVSEAEL